MRTITIPAVTLGIALAALFLVGWPIVGDAPWEAEQTNAIRCQGALDFRESIIGAGEYRSGIALGTTENVDGVEDYDAQLAKAERELDRYC